MSDRDGSSPIAERDENHRQGVQQPRTAGAVLYLVAIVLGMLSLMTLCGLGRPADLLSVDRRGHLIAVGLAGAGVVSAFVLGGMATLLRWAAATYAAAEAGRTGSTRL
jgi:hypothetical protein